MKNVTISLQDVVVLWLTWFMCDKKQRNPQTVIIIPGNDVGKLETMTSS